MPFSRIVSPLLISLLLFSIGRAQLPARYTRYADAVQTLADIQRDNSQICKLDTMGYSTRDSIPMLRFKISDNVGIDEDEPAIFYCGGVHADEVLGVEVVMWFVQDIIEKYNNGDSRIIDYINSLEIFCVPFINPEGHLTVEAGNTEWRKNKCDNDHNGFFDYHDGVDNNRNYDFGWSIDNEIGANTPESLMYKGTAPFTQSENMAMADFAWKYRPLVALDYHSPSYGRPNVAYYPWYWYGNVGGHGMSPDEVLMSSICQSYASLIQAIPDDSSTGTYTARRALVNKGDFKTYFYGNFGTAAFSVEISDTTIQDPALVDSIVAAHLPSQYYLLERSLGAGITGVIRDSVTMEPLEAEVQVLQHINADINPRLSRPEFGRYRRLLAQGSYTLRFIINDYISKTVYNVGVVNSGPTEVDVLLSPLHPRPPAPRQSYPPADTILADNLISFIWNPSDLADYYLLELGYDSEFTDLIVADSTVADTIYAIDSSLPDSVYFWRVKGGNSNGWGPYSQARSFTIDAQTGMDRDLTRPEYISLGQNYPNPFNSHTVIPVKLPAGEKGTLGIYDITGRLVRQINFRGDEPGDSEKVVWDGKDLNGNEIRSGIYFYRIISDIEIKAKKMIYLK